MAFEEATRPGEYFEVIRQLFRSPTAVAIIGGSRGTGSAGEGVSEISGNLAAELASSGNRVVVVSVALLLRMNAIAIPAETDFTHGERRDVWLWPSREGQKIEFIKTREAAKSREPGPSNWLESLRRDFDFVVLDCPSLEDAPGVTEVAAMADAALLAVEAGRTPKQQIVQDQQALRLRGARVAGCILIQGS